MTNYLTCRDIIRFEGNEKTVYKNVIPEIVTRERAEEIWANRGLCWALTMTIHEEAYIRNLWDTMPGNTCFMDAFFRVKKGLDATV